MLFGSELPRQPNYCSVLYHYGFA